SRQPHGPLQVRHDRSQVGDQLVHAREVDGPVAVAVASRGRADEPAIAAAPERSERRLSRLVSNVSASMVLRNSFLLGSDARIVRALLDGDTAASRKWAPTPFPRFAPRPVAVAILGGQPGAGGR